MPKWHSLAFCRPCFEAREGPRPATHGDSMTSTLPSRKRRTALALLALAAASPWAAAQSAWPAKPVTIIVPFPAGGGTDAFARPLFATLTKNLGKQFVVDNRG